MSLTRRRESLTERRCRRRLSRKRIKNTRELNRCFQSSISSCSLRGKRSRTGPRLISRASNKTWWRTSRQGSKPESPRTSFQEWISMSRLLLRSTIAQGLRSKRVQKSLYPSQKRRTLWSWASSLNHLTRRWRVKTQYLRFLTSTLQLWQIAEKDKLTSTSRASFEACSMTKALFGKWGTFQPKQVTMAVLPWSSKCNRVMSISRLKRKELNNSRRLLSDNSKPAKACQVFKQTNHRSICPGTILKNCFSIQPY